MGKPDSARALGHDRRFIHRDGERGQRQPIGVHTEQAIQRLTQSLADQIVQGDVDGGFGGLRAGRQPIENVFDQERIIAHPIGRGGDVVHQALLRIAVVGHHCAFAKSFVEVREDVEALMADAVRDAKGRAKIERDGFGSEKHSQHLVRNEWMCWLMGADVWRSALSLVAAHTHQRFAQIGAIDRAGGIQAVDRRCSTIRRWHESAQRRPARWRRA